MALKKSEQELSQISLGQNGGKFIDVADVDHTGNFVAITVITATKFNKLYPTSAKHFGTAGGSVTPNGDAIVATDEFPAGMTLLGNWDTINIDAGSIVVYQEK